MRFMKREELVSELRMILEPLAKEYSNIGLFGNHESCHGPNISWFEMFCRSSYGIIAYTKATNDYYYLTLFNETLLKVIKDERYSTFKDYDQKAVELVPVATLMYLFRDKTWDIYSKEQKEEISNYLKNIVQIELCSNNWIFFRILVCSILQSLTGNDYSQIIKREWYLVDQWYQGDGWYRDGMRGTKDYYNAFGFHFYSLLYSYLFNDEERNSIVRERSILFAEQYKYFFDLEGRSIPYGRSLIYRYSCLSFWSMMAVNEFLDKDLEKDACSIIWSNYKWWSKQEIYDDKGIQCLGYAYPNSSMLEAYNSSGSVYWSLKFFLILLAGNNSLVWNEPQIANRLEEGTYTLANGDIIIQAGDNSSTAYINSYHGSGHVQDFAKYMHFAYNSATGFNICKSENIFNRLSDDSSLIFDINGIKKKRTDNLFYSCKNSIQEFVWTIDNTIDVVSTVIPLDDYYVRIHVIRSNKSCDCYETGFPIKKMTDKSECVGNGWAKVYNNEISSFIGLIRGQGVPIIINNEEGSNIYYRNTIMPSLRYRINKGNSVIIDYTGVMSAEFSLLDITSTLSDKIKIVNRTVIIDNNDTILRIPIFITNYISRRLFLQKNLRRLKSFGVYVKRTFKGLK
jgi:hypothetical protein